MTRHERTFMGDFRKFFFRGLAILLPSLVTLALVVWAYGFLSANIATPINAGVRQLVLMAGPRVVGAENMPDWYVVTAQERDEYRADNRARDVSDAAIDARVRSEALRSYWDDRWWLEAIGFVVAILLVYLAGVLVGNYIGRRAYARVEGWLIRLPVVKQVYPNVKQVTDFLLGGSEGKRALPTGRVVAVEYPRKGIWTVGLMTGETLAAIEAISGRPSVTIFIPSSPTPFTGYTITVPADEVHELPLSLDEAIRFVVSGGVLVPARAQGEPLPEHLRTPGDGPPTPPDLAAATPPAMMENAPHDDAETDTPPGERRDAPTRE